MVWVEFAENSASTGRVVVGEEGHGDVADHFADQQRGAALFVGASGDGAAVFERRLVALVRDRPAGLLVPQHHVFVRVQVRRRHAHALRCRAAGADLVEFARLEDLAAARLLGDRAVGPVGLRARRDDLHGRRFQLDAFGGDQADAARRLDLDIAHVRVHDDVAAARDEAHAQFVREQAQAAGGAHEDVGAGRELGVARTDDVHLAACAQCQVVVAGDDHAVRRRRGQDRFPAPRRAFRDVAAGVPPFQLVDEGGKAPARRLVVGVDGRQLAHFVEDALHDVGQARQSGAVELAPFRLRARLRADQDALGAAHGHRQVAAQLGALPARRAGAVGARTCQPAEVQFRRAVVAGQLRADLAARVVEAQLVAARPLDLVRARAGYVAGARQRARLAERGRRRALVVQLGEDDRAVRVAAEEGHQHFGTDARQRQRAGLLLADLAVAGPVGRDAYPGRIGRRIGRAGAVRMAMVGDAHAREADFYPAQRVAMDVLAGRPDDDGALQRRLRQVGARIVSGHDRNAAPDGGKADAHARLPVASARRRQRAQGGVRRHLPGVAFQFARQVVVGHDVQFGDHEIALRGGVRVDLGMAFERKILAGAEVAHAALALEALRFEFVAAHAHLAQAPVVLDVVARVRHLDQVVVQRRGERVAARALVHVAARGGRHELRGAGILVVPAVTRGDARLQAARGAPGTDGVAAVRHAVAVVTHRAGRVLRQAVRVVEQHQRVRGRAVVRGVDGAAAAASRPEHPRDAAPLEQAAHERGVRLVVLHGLFARRELAHVEQRIEFEFEGVGQHRVRLAPFVAQHLHDLQLVLVAEHAAVGALFHHGEHVAQDQLVAGQAAVGVARARLGDDAAHAAEHAAVGDELQFGRQRDQVLQRDVRAAGEAGDAVVDAAADRLVAHDPLGQQHVLRELAALGQAQAQRPVRGAQDLLVLQNPQELARAFHCLSREHAAAAAREWILPCFNRREINVRQGVQERTSAHADGPTLRAARVRTARRRDSMEPDTPGAVAPS